MEIGIDMQDRFSDAPAVPNGIDPALFQSLTGRGSVRHFSTNPVDEALIDYLCGVAFCAPTKSDLQQRDIIITRDQGVRLALVDCCDTQKWVADAPVILVFCGNHRRQKRLSELQNLAFANHHLDAFFNASVDAALALAYFVAAAETAGLGCCPISAIRNRPRKVSDVLKLPELVFPVAALAVGWPASKPSVSQRLPLQATVHIDRFNDGDEAELIAAYDQRRSISQPYASQRGVKQFGHSDAYGWSEDKARQYAKPERADFGAYIRDQGFKLD